ncbi:glucocorticoid modulatory element-binding protein 1 isoform X3 [Ambystoma mexicanum]|uniref:glucocorticoid modulatory element-binding protein 1 isoform X3 n=1 Tax=Ambystoma mexicanum TaxID=8296 RepID=UPI0037E7A464
MANAEVNVPVGEVVVVPSEGNEDENPEDAKTQVILQLQPLQQGSFFIGGNLYNRIMEEGPETNSAVMSMETHSLKMEDGFDATLLEDNEDIEIAYPITCGESKAILLWKKFVCPGINVKCVKFNDQMISPKHFVNIAGKSTLKDWKRAIRLGGTMLRKMMDSGQIDFYQHDKVCTNTCRSTKFDLLISSARAPVPGAQSTILQTPTSADGSITQIAVSEEGLDEGGIEWNSALTAAVQMVTDEGTKKEGDDISEETLMFWKGIADVGLMDEVVSNIQKEMQELLRGVQERLGQSLLQVTDLDRQLEEQKRQAVEQKMKSQTIQNVVLMPMNTPNPKPAKRPRLQRPASATVLGSSTPTQQQQQQYTVISPISLSSLGQPFTMSNVPLTTLSQGSNPMTLHTLPSGQHVFRYATVVSSSKTSTSDTVTIHPTSSLALLSSAAMQDSNNLVSPMELVAMESELATAVEGTADEEGQTIIEIDPAPDPEAEMETKVTTLTELKEDEDDDGHEVQNEEIHNVEIVVLEEEE